MVENNSINNTKILRTLKEGDDKQNKAFHVIESSHIIQKLEGFKPAFIGTIPLGIHTKESDIDIVCEFHEKNLFIQKLNSEFQLEKNFILREKDFLGVPSVICSFNHRDEKFEIFGQKLPIEEQYGYRHFVVEYRLIELCTKSDKREIIKLKESGIKTEPAFAKHFSITGDPYESLYNMYNLTDKELKKTINLIH